MPRLTAPEDGGGNGCSIKLSKNRFRAKAETAVAGPEGAETATDNVTCVLPNVKFKMENREPIKNLTMGWNRKQKSRNDELQQPRMNINTHGFPEGDPATDGRDFTDREGLLNHEPRETREQFDRGMKRGSTIYAHDHG